MPFSQLISYPCIQDYKGKIMNKVDRAVFCHKYLLKELRFLHWLILLLIKIHSSRANLNISSNSRKWFLQLKLSQEKYSGYK
jgi:hypothetical protein